jgi:hypothetical protein
MLSPEILGSQDVIHHQDVTTSAPFEGDMNFGGKGQSAVRTFCHGWLTLLADKGR